MKIIDKNYKLFTLLYFNIYFHLIILYKKSLKSLKKSLQHQIFIKEYLSIVK